MHKTVDITNLAYRTGCSVSDVHLAGRKLFEQLSGEDSDLTKALIQASSSSGLDPQHVLMILKVMAEDFQQSVDAEEPGTLAQSLQDMAEDSVQRLKATSIRARDAVSSIDVDALRSKGEEIADNIRSNIAAIDLGPIRERAIEAGETIIEKVRLTKPGQAGKGNSKSSETRNG